MFADLFAALRVGFTRPRVSARAFLSSGAGLREACYLALLAFCLTALGEKAVTLALGGESAMSGAPMLIVHLALQFFQLLAMAVASHELGAKFGGRATRAQMAVLSGWHLVLQAAMTPIQILAARVAMTGDGSLLVLLLPLSVGLLIWIYASFVAEAHGFKRIGPVLVATFVGFMLLGAIAQVALSAVLISQGQLPVPGGTPGAGPGIS